MAVDQVPCIGLALSGGGARAMAFHLGCLRALHDRNLLSKVRVLSTVSGGSVIGACWAYRDQSFEDFDRHIVALLRRGLQWDIAREAFCSSETLKIVATWLVTGTLTALLSVLSFAARRGHRWLGLPTAGLAHRIDATIRYLPIWANLTTALEKALARTCFDETTLDQVRHDNLVTVINACELRTGTAFRFGSQHTGSWRYGRAIGQPPKVAKAVAASAAFPILLPPLIETFAFEQQGRTQCHTVSLTDGGVYDNLGTAVLEPGRADDSLFRYPVTHIITLNAGAGQLDADDPHYWWFGRVARSFKAVHRKAQDAVYQRLHAYVESGAITAFGMVYLGQQDQKLPSRPPDLVPRDRVRDYPTDFSPMSDQDLIALTRRGEQLTHIIVGQYLADICD